MSKKKNNDILKGSIIGGTIAAIGVGGTIAGKYFYDHKTKKTADTMDDIKAGVDTSEDVSDEDTASEETPEEQK